MNLNDAAYISFSTFRKNGNTVETPVWFAPSISQESTEDKNSYYIFSAGEAGKVKRLRNFSRSRIAPCTVTGRILGGWHDSEAVILESVEPIKTAHAALIKHYGWQMRLLDISSKLSGKFNKRAYIKVTLKESLG